MSAAYALATADPTAPWVSVDDEGQPATTITPSWASPTASADADAPSASVIDGAPHDLTASVFTWTSLGRETTSTGAPPNPTATKAGTLEGAVSRCFNRDEGNLAPFCRPLPGSTLFTGKTYYVTWNPDFYNTTQTKHSKHELEIAVRIDYLNQTSNAMVKLDTYNRVPARFGFWPLVLKPDVHLMGLSSNNATLTLLASANGSDEKQRSVSLPVILAQPSVGPPKPLPKPNRTALMIGLPVALGAFVLILVGLCVWHRKTRRIQLGNVMGRVRNRVSSSGRRRSDRRRRIMRATTAAAAASKEEEERSIPLNDTPSPPAHRSRGVFYRDDVETPRRDSDALGRFATSPVYGGGGGGNNAFRDEVQRQEREKRDNMF